MSMSSDRLIHIFIVTYIMIKYVQSTDKVNDRYRDGIIAGSPLF